MIDMMTEGKSLTQVAAALGVRKNTIYVDWPEKYPDFKEAKARGTELSEAWWEELGRQISAGMVKSPPIAYIYNMKCRFQGQWLHDGTHNKLEVTNKYESIPDKDLKTLIQQKLDSRAKKLSLVRNEIEINPEAVPINVDGSR